jgi:hypothetical protein
MGDIWIVSGILDDACYGVSASGVLSLLPRGKGEGNAFTTR